ncbi:hypothetical protein [Pontibacillus chungwhensis]|uniref:Sodium:proton antiporter n=2 Tax=Pontibacillus TaxID=289201 RepID=A0ABY8UZ59_9BACI|nr:hypothetical protein [Pontibacillus chungwhensis]MCD5323572.1 hypothetical protein [Pontibacillus sp. HN14]WIF96941.1 hypothetical protein QNI29_14455 [Pontibacillus chungwhensis]
MMRVIMWLFFLIAGMYALNRYKYRILNGVLAYDLLRKVAVRVSMRMPYLREKILPQILGRSTF